ncbi:MAG: 50S ribosomal protein L9 [Eubacterium sp.]|nr:50S ribosomal protein L9 [Eubacterium sp.]
MKIILTQDVKSLGKKGEVVEVNQGYARNFVLPKKLGVEATPKNLNDLKLKNQNDEKVAAENLAAAEQLRDELKDKKITAQMKVGANGKTFGSVSSKEIAELMKSQLGIDIDKKKIVLDDAVKSLGGYNVKLKLHPKVTAEIMLDVVEQK